MKKKVLLIGASTGGPSQIKQLLKEITNLSSTIIINQHMKEEVLPFFVKDLQNYYDFKIETTPLDFSFDTPRVIICSHSSKMEKRCSGFAITTHMEQQHYTPDINQFFTSFSPFVNLFDTDVLIMTGIGNDGVQGAISLKKLGAKIYAQDEQSSPVYGMPKAAYESEIVDEVMSFTSLKKYFRSL